jgi:hypothetical protein
MSANFSRTLAGLRQKQVIIPVLRAAFSDPSFKGFTVNVDGWNERKFDGWFHPSTHASWTARQLALYLIHGEDVPLERPTMTFVAAVTQGTFWHNLTQRVLMQEGVLRRNPGTTGKDSIDAQCEIQLVDAEHNRRGHADGRMATCDDELFEFKTINDRSIAKYDFATGEATLKEKNPFGYYSQCQDYLAISGMEKMRYFMMSLASPFPMVEFIVHADERYQAAQKAKYLEALEAAQTGSLPDACCGVGSKMAKACPLKDFCPIGKMS